MRRTFNVAADRLATIGNLAAVEAAVAQVNMEPTLNIWERQPKTGPAESLPLHVGWPVNRSDTPFWATSDQPGGSNETEGRSC